MALQNNIISGPTRDINYSAFRDSGEYEFKFVITAADLAALGAYLTGDVILFKMPPTAFITYTFTKHSVPVSGTDISACSAQVMTATAARAGSALDVFASASATAYDVYHPITQAQIKEATLASDTPVYVHFIAVGANLANVTAGSITVVVGYRVFDA